MLARISKLTSTISPAVACFTVGHRYASNVIIIATLCKGPSGRGVRIYVLEVPKVTKRTRTLRIEPAWSIGPCFLSVSIPQHPNGRVLFIKHQALPGLIISVFLGITKCVRVPILHFKIGWTLTGKVLTPKAPNFDLCGKTFPFSGSRSNL